MIESISRMLQSPYPHPLTQVVGRPFTVIPNGANDIRVSLSNASPIRKTTMLARVALKLSSGIEVVHGAADEDEPSIA